MIVLCCALARRSVAQSTTSLIPDAGVLPKRAEIDLGGSFHRSRIKLISSQVSTVSPDLSGRWNKARRFNSAWSALERIKPEKWITHRFPIQEGEKAYQLLDQNAQETIQVILDYRS